jgi:hypothetical protein
MRLVEPHRGDAYVRLADLRYRNLKRLSQIAPAACLRHFVSTVVKYSTSEEKWISTTCDLCSVPKRRLSSTS